MDWDLWSASYFNDAPPECDYQKQPGYEFEPYFGNGPGVLHENALNEKCCAQVLRILMAKADGEIDELEEELVLLKSQLACLESAEWSKNCCISLNERMKYLSISIWRLKSKDEHAVNVYLKMHRNPVDRIHEVLKALLENYLVKEEQPLAVIVKEPSSDTRGHATGFLDERKNLENNDSNIKEEIQESSVTPSEKCTAPKSSSRLEGKKTDSPKEVQRGDIIVRRSSVDASKIGSGQSIGKKRSCNSDLKITREEVNEHQSTPTSKSKTLDPSLEPGEKKTDFKRTVKPANITSKSPTLDASEQVTGCSNGGKKMCKPDSKFHVKEEVKELKSMPTERCIAPHTSLKSAGKGTNLPETNKLVDSTVRYSSSDSMRDATGLNWKKFSTGINEKKNLCNSASSFNAIELAKSGFSDVNPKERTSALETTPNDSFKESNVALLKVKVEDAVINGTGNIAAVPLLELQVQNKKDPLPKLKGEGKTLPDEVQKVKIVANAVSNLKFPLKSQRQQEAKRTVLPNPPSSQEGSIPMEIDSNVSSISTAKKQRKSIMGEDAVINDTGNIAAVSLLELQVQNKKDPAQPKLREEGKTLPDEVQKVEIVVNAVSNFKFPLKSQRQQEAKRTVLPNPPSAQEGSIPMEIDSNVSSISTAKKQRKSVMGEDAVINDTGNIAAVPLLELQVQNKKDPAQPKLKEEGKTLPDEVQKVEIVVNAVSNFKFPLKSQRQQEAKRTVLPNPPSVQEGSPSMEIVSNISTISKAKKQGKSVMDDDITLVQYLKKFIHPDRGVAKDCGVAPNVSKKSVKQSQNNKKRSDFPVIVEIKATDFHNELSKLHGGDTTKLVSKIDNPITNTCSILNSTEKVVPPQPNSRFVNLSALSLVDLRAIAKQHKMIKYHKLRKPDLVQQIAVLLQ